MWSRQPSRKSIHADVLQPICLNNGLCQWPVEARLRVSEALQPPMRDSSDSILSRTRALLPHKPLCLFALLDLVVRPFKAWPPDSCHLPPRLNLQNQRHSNGPSQRLAHGRNVLFVVPS
ncbi:unnamed protein product [Protopolystoma xenopodis]|uniref:Uncharacterized protein n=1 Tax=Protopolystoma xenopodis TaxID=117903 RepID=A0A3S5B3H3_9PLAT|nr:unnamed protein product [Protopolystoma xenopodis]